MQLSTARVAPLTGSADLDPEVLRGLIWRHHATGDRVEHVRVRAGPGYLDIAIYTLTDDETESDNTTRNLIDRTLTSTPELHLWRVI